MNIDNNVLKYYLRNVYFITGTAYAGKSTMTRMLAEKYDLVFCGENYHLEVTDKVADPNLQPNLCYMRQLKDWKDFVKRSPKKYEQWIYDSQKEVAGFEIAELIARGASQKVIVDTNIPVPVLKQISDYNHVAVTLSPQSVSVERFFERTDPEKQFILQVIESCDEPEKVMENYRECLKRVNSEEHYNEYAHSGFFTLERDNPTQDDASAVCDLLARHFGLI